MGWVLDLVKGRSMTPGAVVVWSLFLALALLGGCRDRGTPRPAPRGSSRVAMPSEHRPLALRVDGSDIALPYARASIGHFDTLVVELSDRPLVADQEPAGNALRVELPAGPSRQYFAGAELPLAVLVRLANEHRTHEIPAYRASLRLAPLRRVVGARVIGTLVGRDTADFGAVATSSHEVACAGDFDVAIASVSANYNGTAPSEVRAGPVAGRFNARDYTAGSALAVLGVAADGARFVRRLYLFEEAGVTCQRRHEVAHRGAFVLVSPWGGDGIAARTGVAMPIKPGYGFDNASASWVRFDTVATEAGGALRGALYEGPARVEGDTREPDFQFDGTFAGLVCADTPDPYVLPPRR